MRYGISQWLDITNLRAVYSVRVKPEGQGWAHVREGPAICLFPERGEAEMFRDLLKLGSVFSEYSQPKEPK
jgi:hypothetical protein